MNKKILVLGASGNVGVPLVKTLVQRGIAVKAGSRHGKPVANAESVYFDFSDPESFIDASKDITDVYIMFPTLFDEFEKALMPILEHAKKQNIRLILHTAIEVVTTENHRLRNIEELIKTSGIQYVILRPSWFMENFFIFYQEQLSSGVLTLPAEYGKMSWVAIDDIVACATQVLLSNQYQQQCFNITGAEALSFQETLEIINKGADTNFQYQPARNLNSYVQEEIELYQGVAKGLSAFISNDIFRLTEKPAIRFKQFVLQHRSEFKAISQEYA